MLVTFYALVSMKLLNLWHFNTYFISHTGTGVQGW